MLHNQLDFVIPDDLSIAELIAQLRKDFTIRAQGEAVIHRVFYDTFDWRLYKSGSVLELQEEERNCKIYWRAGKLGNSRIQLGLKKVPQLASELPGGALRQQLQSVISVRELTARIKVRINRRLYAVLDKHDKVVVRIYIDKYWYKPSRLRADKLLARRLIVKPVKGYLKKFQKVTAFLQASKLYPTQDNVMKLALAAKGETAGEYNARVNLRFDPDKPAAETCNAILSRLLEIMQQNSSGCVEGRDTEFLHDYRDVIQKTRYALKLLKVHKLTAVDTRYNDLFSMLDELTAPVRHLDVFLLQLADYQQGINEEGQQRLQALRDYLQLSRTQMQQKLVDGIKSSSCREDIKQWQDYLVHPSDDAGVKATTEVACKLVDEIAWETFQNSKKQGRAFVKNQKDEALRELKQSLDELSYLMEFFRSFYSALKIRELIQLVSALKDDLEILSELTKQIDLLREYMQQGAGDALVHACEQMLGLLQQRQDSIMEQFAGNYAIYSSAATRKKFNDVFIDYHNGKKP